MRIVPNQRFLDGTDEYLPDNSYDVPVEKGVYFCNNGWADSAEALPAYTPPVANLDIQNLNVEVKDSNG